ncbi:MAG: hypothetical protein EOO05_08150 [Chitinophagaceae bacterium]|nr:MAG: hypothetical protein EOO05_08150 [Chitinophagaceae bacterium]
MDKATKFRHYKTTKMKKIGFSIAVLFCFTNLLTAQKLPRIPCSADMSSVRFQKIDTTPGRAVTDNYRTWDNGKVLLVKFMPGGSKALRDMVMANAKTWEMYGNVKFKFVGDTAKTTDLRVQLGRGRGHNSSVGKDAVFTSQKEATINFDTLYFADVNYYLAKLKGRGVAGPYSYDNVDEEMSVDPFHWSAKEVKRVVTHEFGHSLGLLHEQSYPDAIHWKKTDSVYNYYKETQGWDKDKVDFNVFESNDQFSTNGTQYDPKSIMHYSIESWQTEDGYSLADNYDLSTGDKMVIAALYPKNAKISVYEVPKVDITPGAKFRFVIDTVKKGLSVFPILDLKTNSKLGTVYFVVKLVNEDDYYVLTQNEFYNWGGVAASYVQMNLLPNSKVSYNKTKKNLEIFFPFAQMPDLEGKPVKIEFSVVLDDVKNGQFNKLMYNTLTTPLSLKK